MFFQANCVNRKLVFHKKQEYVLIIFLFLDFFKSFHDLLHLSIILLIVDCFLFSFFFLLFCFFIFPFLLRVFFIFIIFTLPLQLPFIFNLFDSYLFIFLPRSFCHGSEPIRWIADNSIKYFCSS